MKNKSLKFAVMSIAAAMLLSSSLAFAGGAASDSAGPGAGGARINDNTAAGTVTYTGQNTPIPATVGMTYNTDTGSLWLFEHSTQNVWEYNLAGLPTGGGFTWPYAEADPAHGLTFNPVTGTFFASSASSATVTESDYAGNPLSLFQTSRSDQTGIAANHNTGNLYVTQYAAGTIEEYTSAGVLAGTFAAMTTPLGMHYDPCTDHLCAVHNNGTDLIEMDLTGTILATYNLPAIIGVSVRIRGLAFDYDNGFFYAANELDGVLYQLKYDVSCGGGIPAGVDIDQLYTFDGTGAWSAEFAPGDVITVNEAITIVGDPAQVYDMQVRYYFTDAAGNNFLLGKQLYRNYSPGTVYVSLTGAVPANAAPGRGAVRNAALLAQGPVLLDRGTLAGYVNISGAGGAYGFVEDFNDGAADNWVDDGSGRWSVTNEYVMSGNSSLTWGTSSYNDTYSDFVYEVSLQKTAGDGTSMGLLFRENDYFGAAGDGYGFWITSTGDCSVWKHVGGVSSTLVPWTASAFINQGLGAWNTLAVDVNGSTLTFYINGNLLTSLVDSSFASGKAGVAVYDSSPDVVHYDNASLTCGGGPAAVAPVAVTPIDPVAAGIQEHISE